MKKFTMRTLNDDLFDVELEGDVLKIAISETYNGGMGMVAEINYSDFLKLIAILEK